MLLMKGTAPLQLSGLLCQGLMPLLAPSGQAVPHSADLLAMCVVSRPRCRPGASMRMHQGCLV